MLDDTSQNQSPYKKKVRVRVCGILKKNNKILLLKHNGIGIDGFIWSPPGGGVEFGQTLVETIKREFLEETNMVIDIENYLFANEHIDDLHHAIEFFFSVRHISGNLKLGSDPELPVANQMLLEAKFFSEEEIRQLPVNKVHSAFHPSKMPDKIEDRRGLITFKD